MMDEHSEALGIAYRSSGPADGPLALCLHGFPDIPRTWDALGAALSADGFRVVAPWLPGYSPSSLEGPLDAIAVSEQLLRFIDQLAPSTPVHLVGHDWGAVCSHVMLARAPQRFRAAAVLSVPHPLAIEQYALDYPKQLVRSSYIALFQVRGLAERLVAFRDYALIERLWRLWSPGFDPGHGYLEEVKQCLRESMPAPLAYYRALPSPPFVRAFHSILDTDPIPVPTLYLHGERDGCITADLAGGQARYFSALFETVRLAEAGHFVHLERPHVVNQTICEWFRAHP